MEVRVRKQTVNVFFIVLDSTSNNEDMYNIKLKHKQSGVIVPHNK